MKTICLLCAAAFLLPMLAHPADYNLGELVKSKQIELFNRTFDQTKAGSTETVFLNAAANDGLAWINGAGLSEGTIELEIKGKVGLWVVNGSDGRFRNLKITPAAK